MLARLSLAMVVSVLGLSTTGCSGPTEEPAFASDNTSVSRIPVQVAPVVQSDVVASIELVGSLIPRRRSVIVSDVDGVVETIPVSQKNTVELEVAGALLQEAPRLDIGVDVAEDAVLVQLDQEEYQLKLQAAESRLNTAVKQAENLYAWRRPEEVQRIEAEREEAAARVVLADANLHRSKGLIERNAIAQANLDQHEADVKTARAGLARTDAELALAKAGPTKEEIAVAVAAIAQTQSEVDRAKWELEKTTIRAPYDGVVTERFVDEGERVTAMPRVEIMELMDLSILSAQLCVPERYINRIRVRDSAQIFVKSPATPVPGVVCLVNDKVDSENRTFRIRISIPNEDRRLKVGQFVRVSVQIDSSPDTLTVSSKAIVYTGGEAHVFVCQDNRVAMRALKLGLMNGETAEVLSGLSVGEQVVVDDPSILSDGMAVQASSERHHETF